MNLAVAPEISARTGETDEAYGAVLATLKGKLRVIHSRDANQWILQSRKSPTRWESFAYCGTKEGLLLRIKEHLQGRDEILPLETLASRDCDPVAWAAIEALPEYYPKLAARRMEYT